MRAQKLPARSSGGGRLYPAMRLREAALGVLFTLAMSLPANASALTLGSVDPSPTDPGFRGDCVGNLGNLLQGSTASQSPSYVVPRGGGVIRRWNTRYGMATSAVSFEVWRPTKVSDQYKLVGIDNEKLAPGAGGVSSYAVSIPVQEGDILGMGWSSDETVHCVYQSNNDSDSTRAFTGMPSKGGSHLFDNPVDGDLLNVSVNLRQTADLAISEQVKPSTVHHGSLVDLLLSVTNHGPAPVTAVVKDTLPNSFKLLSAVADKGYCKGKHPVRCYIALPVGATSPVSITAVPQIPGMFTNAIRVSSSATDPKPGNNAAAAKVHVT